MAENTKTVAVYHKDCPDGTTAAAVLLLKFPDAILFPLKHSVTEDSLRAVSRHVDATTMVYTLDCAIGIEEWLKRAGAVVTIDHHVGTKEKLEQLTREHKHFTYVFDNERSGASLGWVYFFDKETPPYLVRLVQDFDLWQWKLGDDTKYAAAFLSTIRNEPEKVQKYLSGPIDEILTTGKHMAAYAESLIRFYCKDAAPIRLRIGEATVPAYNALFFQSEIGNHMSKRLGQAVALFTIQGERVEMSFRSLDRHTPSALDLAKILSGGGHRNASGASISRGAFLEMIAS